MPHQIYNVPLIISDLRRQEAVHQICDSLEYLEKVTKDIFDKISARVGENQVYVQSINHRVDVAQAKIDFLKGSHKATKVS